MGLSKVTTGAFLRKLNPSYDDRIIDRPGKTEEDVSIVQAASEMRISICRPAAPIMARVVREAVTRLLVAINRRITAGFRRGAVAVTAVS
jgi:hypothetical protein